LKGYDYAQAGLYFTTICCKGRICRFGEIENGKMLLNDAGKIMVKWYNELENKLSENPKNIRINTRWAYHQYEYY
jgi:hypothetical protein